LSTSKPFFTALILTHNYGRYVSRAIESVLEQTCPSWELFICDDASTDETANIVEPYLRNPRIHFVHHKTNLGQSRNWSCALDLGEAPFVGILHADDYWLPETLQTVHDEFAANNQVDMVYGNWIIARENAQSLAPANQSFDHLLTGPETFAHQISRNLWLPSATFARRSLIQSAGKPNPDLEVHVDLEYHLRLAAGARYVRGISKALTVYRVHEQSVTTRYARAGALLREMQEFPDVIARWAAARPELANGLPTLRRIAAEGVLSAGITASANGDRSRGDQLMRRARELSRHISRKPKVMLDRLLLSSGGPGYELFRLLHRGRIGA
jgi:hypothetical protein